MVGAANDAPVECNMLHDGYSAHALMSCVPCQFLVCCDWGMMALSWGVVSQAHTLLV